MSQKHDVLPDSYNLLTCKPDIKDITTKELKVGKATSIEGLKKSIMHEFEKGVDLILVNAIGASALMVAHKSVSLSTQALRNSKSRTVYVDTARVFEGGNEIMVIKISNSPLNL